MNTAKRVEDIGNPKKLSKEKLTTGIEVLTRIIDGTSKDLKGAQRGTREKPLQAIEYKALVRTYESAINRAEKMRRNYQREWGLR